MNFGTLKDIFTEKLIESYISDDKKGKTLYKNFLKILKENETLRTAFIVYKNLETKTIKNEVEAIEYLKESISLLQEYKGEKSVTKQSEKLISLLETNGIDVQSVTTKKIHEDIENLITTKKNASTIDVLHESKKDVVSWLMSDKEVINEEQDYVNTDVDPKKFLEIAVNKFNEKYNDSLTEEEKSILKVLRENNEDNNKTLVSNLVKETIELVNNLLQEYSENTTVKSKLLETKEAIYNMAENNDSYSEKILKLYELKNNLKND